MATVTGYTAARMKQIEDSAVVDGDVVGDNLILTKHDGSTVDAGNVRGPVGATGPKGDPGAAGTNAIPGEVKLWSGATLPNQTKYGKWVWADGAVYPVATYPEAAGAIGSQWRTFAGASDPGAGNFRVPDLRGLVPAGMDAMPGGARANRMTRAVAATLAAKAGEEMHLLTSAESGLQEHRHSMVTYDTHNIGPNGQINSWPIGNDVIYRDNLTTQAGPYDALSSHENVQPTVFVPYIIFLGG